MTYNPQYPEYRPTAAHFSLPSIIALAAAIGAFFVSAGWGVFLAIIAIIFGLIGAILAFSPTVRGGIISILAIVLAPIGIIVAIVRLVI